MGKRFYRLWPELVSFENLYVPIAKPRVANAASLRPRPLSTPWKRI